MLLVSKVGLRLRQRFLPRRQTMVGTQDRVRETCNCLLGWKVSAVGQGDGRGSDLHHETIREFFEIGLTTLEVTSITGHRARMLFRYSRPMRTRILQVVDGASR